MSGPIKPKEVQNKKNASIPNEVFEVVNDLIVKNWDGHSATVTQEEAAKKIANALNITTAQLFDRNLLDIESAYRKVGWKVKYDKPGYNENYAAYFVFSK